MNNNLIETNIVMDGELPMNDDKNIGKIIKVTKSKKNHDTTLNSRYLDDYPDVLTPTECQNILLVGRNTIYKLLQNNVIKAVKIGKQYRIPKSSLQNYLEMCYNSDHIDNSASA